MQHAMREWAAEVEKFTAGNVKIEFAAASLVPPQQQMSAVQSGIFDVGFIGNPYIFNRAPLISFSSLRWLISDAEAASVALWRIYEKTLASKKQYADVQLLALFHFAGAQLYSLNDKPINSVDELKSRKMWALPGEAADLLKNLGMSRITSPAPQISESVSRGVVDEYYGITLDSDTNFKATAYTKAVTLFPRGATSSSFSMFINKDKWASLSEKDRAVAISRQLEAEYAYLNAHGSAAQDGRGPFGGFKQSGIGRNLGCEGVIQFQGYHSISDPAGWLA